MGKLHRVCIIRRKTGNIPGERYAWIKFTIYDKEKQEAGEFVYGNLRVCFTLYRMDLLCRQI